MTFTDRLLFKISFTLNPVFNLHSSINIVRMNLEEEKKLIKNSNLKALKLEMTWERYEKYG